MAKLTYSIRTALKKCGMSMYEIEKRSGYFLTQVELGRVKNGKGWLGPEKLDALAAIIGITVTVKDK